MRLVVKIAREQGCGFRAWCSALPGCSASAATKAEVKSKIRDAVAGYVASMDVALPQELGRKLEVRIAAGAA